MTKIGIKTTKMKNKRIHKGLTQVELAKMLGTSQSVLSKFENGKQKPRGDIAKKLSKILDVPLEDII